MAANNGARSYSSDHVEGGYTDRAIHLNTAEIGVQLAENAVEIINLLLDGDPHNDHLAIGLAADISEIASHLSHTHWLAADGNRAAAKKSAKNMVEKGSKSHE